MSNRVSQLNQQSCACGWSEPLVSCETLAMGDWGAMAFLSSYSTQRGGGRVSAWPTVAPAAASQGEAIHSTRGPTSLQLPHPWPPQIGHSPCAFCGTLPLDNPQLYSVLSAQYQPVYVQPIIYLLSITNSSFFLVRTSGFGISSFFLMCWG